MHMQEVGSQAGSRGGPGRGPGKETVFREGPGKRGSMRISSFTGSFRNDRSSAVCWTVACECMAEKERADGAHREHGSEDRVRTTFVSSTKLMCGPWPDVGYGPSFLWREEAPWLLGKGAPDGGLEACTGGGDGASQT